jgi:predicted DCC family thiol-disulfide oxidoreductase YuxK
MTTAPAGPTDRGPSDAPVTRLTVLYDQGCPLCRHVRGWLERQRALVPLDFVPAGTAKARERFPALDHSRTLREITVIGDAGQVYEGAAAWVVVLWALHGYRPTSHRLGSPAGAQLARGMVLAAAKWRQSSQASARRRAASGRPTSSQPTAASRRPTAQGTAGRPGAPFTPGGKWIWTGQSWQPTFGEGHCPSDDG